MTDVPRDFKVRQEYYTQRWGTFIDESWKKNLNHLLSVFHLLQFSKIKTVLELGCSDGGLAIEIMNSIHYDLRWTGYDFLPYEIEHSKKHENYEAHLLDRFLWDTADTKTYDVFVSSHLLEHLYPEDIIALFEWLNGRVKYLVQVAPLGLTSTPVKDGHIFPDGCKWVSEVIQSNGFTPVWEMGRWFGWFMKK